jgi:hypothetical protein
MLRTTLAALLAFMLGGPVSAGEPVDLALVLAVDVSGSVTRQEYDLQIGGIVRAFRQPDVIAAIASGTHGRIAVNLMTWGDPDYQKFDTGWHVVGDAGSADVFAEAVDKFEGRIGGGTGIGVAIGYSITLIETSGFPALRKVVDVSGDGTELGEIRTPRFRVEHAAAMRDKHGVIVNGLAIRSDKPELDQYYRAHVAGGPGSFVISIDSFDDYAEAIHRKLLREIVSPTSSLPLDSGRAKLARQ